MRSPSLYAGRPSAVEIPMTPMIDVVFQLIIFFLCTSSFNIIEHSLPGRMAVTAGTEASTTPLPPPPEADFDEIVVRVTRDNGQLAWRVNDIPLASLVALRARLQQIAAINRSAPVILHPDADVPLGDVIDAYDIARLERFEVAFTTTLPGAQPSTSAEGP